MARIIKKPGDLLKFPLSEAGKHAYCQWLADGTARVFLAACAAGLTCPEIMALPVAFRVPVCNDTPNRYGWEKVGRAGIPASCLLPQRYVKKDAFTGALNIYFDGQEAAATRVEVQGLEMLTFWPHPRIVERLEAQLAGRPSVLLKGVRAAA